MRRRLRRLVWLAFLPVLWLGWGSICPAWSSASPYRETLDDGDTLLVVGDLQRTSLAEAWLLRREQNDAARRRVLRAMEDETDVAGLLLLGDLVFDGSSCGDWTRLDAELDPQRERAMLLVPGNHDYWGLDAQACARLRERFPSLAERTWRTVRFGELALVLLDSNPDVIGPGGWSAQRSWLREELRSLKDDRSVRGVVFAMHHPARTNSTVTEDDDASAELVELARETIEPMLVLSGHAHAYEHFVVGARHHVVSGGGGGPRVTLLEGEARRHRDRFEGPSPRPFHYLRLRRRAEGLVVEAHGFRTGESEVRRFDRFVVPWPEAPAR
ncbi:MAG: metallophosphoesterase [Sandaracinus sp.]|nr:metallophosphoesterase [Sandaracinus sp.]